MLLPGSTSGGTTGSERVAACLVLLYTTSLRAPYAMFLYSSVPAYACFVRACAAFNWPTLCFVLASAIFCTNLRDVLFRCDVLYQAIFG